VAYKKRQGRGGQRLDFREFTKVNDRKASQVQRKDWRFLIATT
jgi:hypothetical protein